VSRRSKRRRRRARKRPEPQGGGLSIQLDTTKCEEWRIGLGFEWGEGAASSDLVALLAPLRECLLSVVSLDSCICSTRILLGVAQAMGIEARPQAVHVEIRNAILVRYLDSTPSPTEDPDEIQRLKEAGAYMLRTDSEAAPVEGNAWNGHLVAVIEDSWLLDITADQFNRPRHGVTIDHPLVMPWNVDGASGRRSDDLTVDYYPSADLSYEDSPDWRRRYVVTVNGQEVVL
jgi:hypothetical protein